MGEDEEGEKIWSVYINICSKFMQWLTLGSNLAKHCSERGFCVVVRNGDLGKMKQLGIVKLHLKHIYLPYNKTKQNGNPRLGCQTTTTDGDEPDETVQGGLGLLQARMFDTAQATSWGHDPLPIWAREAFLRSNCLPSLMLLALIFLLVTETGGGSQTRGDDLPINTITSLYDIIQLADIVQVPNVRPLRHRHHRDSCSSRAMPILVFEEKSWSRRGAAVASTCLGSSSLDKARLQMNILIARREEAVRVMLSKSSDEMVNIKDKHSLWMAALPEPACASAVALATFLSLGINLGGQPDKGKDLCLGMHSDASFADDKASRCSTAGYIIFFSRGPIPWRWKKQNLVITLSTKAEFIALKPAALVTIWIWSIVKDVGYEQKCPLLLYTDSQNALLAVLNPLNKTRTRHVDMCYKWIQQRHQQGFFRAASVILIGYELLTLSLFLSLSRAVYGVRLKAGIRRRLLVIFFLRLLRCNLPNLVRRSPDRDTTLLSPGTKNFASWNATITLCLMDGGLEDYVLYPDARAQGPTPAHFVCTSIIRISTFRAP
ncbi:hypothetical protein L249_0512 [Ophiocordyceps polyrhachis-furcata BCC 54312]|uniref:Uncharacterized protein n=1 Tax=Ophiocordyceps polyrhachis-furcata BCC 54312 TaxID=1330021 RepID=A0A367LCA7_9HYPO|nr:hypothetical protein L249_0512 [Ophiocordyceps polyrhachis-furcata BCC 54312]